MKLRHCIICGAKVRNWNPKANTCSSFCTEIKHSGKTREELIREHSMDLDEATWRPRSLCEIQLGSHKAAHGMKEES